MGHTLSEVHAFSLNGPKDEQLRVERAKDMKDECEEVNICVTSAQHRPKNWGVSTHTKVLVRVV